MLFHQRAALLSIIVVAVFAGGSTRAAELKEIASIEIPGGAAKGKAPSATFSPNGKLLAVVGNDLGVYIFDAKTRQSIGKIEVPGNVGEEASWAIRFSSDGKLLACASANKRIYLFDTATLKALRVTATLSDITYVFNFSFDDSKIVARLPNDRIHIVLDVASGKILHTKKVKSETWPLVTMNPVADEAAVVTTNPFMSIAIMNLTTGEIIKEKKVGGTTPRMIGYSPDGKTLFVDREEICYIINAADLSVRKEIEDSFSDFQFTKDSSTIIFTNYAIQTFDVQNLKQSPPIDFTSSTEGSISGTRLSPDDNLLAISLYNFRDESANLVLFDLKQKSTVADFYKLLKRNTSDYDLSPDGAQLITVSEGESRVRIWDISPWSTPVALPDSTDSFRTWTSANGKFQVVATLVSNTTSHVTLKRKDNGATVTIPITGLSDADQQFVKSLR